MLHPDAAANTHRRPGRGSRRSRGPALVSAAMVIAAILTAGGAVSAEPDYGGRDEAWTSELGRGWIDLHASDAAGNSYLVAFTPDPAAMTLTTLDANGSLRWTRTVPFSGNVNVDAIVVDPDGSSIFIAMTKTLEDRVFVATRSYAGGTGEPRWGRSLRLPRNSDVRDMAVSRTGEHVYVVGSGYTVPSGHPPFVIARDTRDGSLDWVWRSGVSLTPFDVAVRPSGRNVYVTGEGERGASVVALRTANGALRWRRRIETTELEDRGTHIAIDPTGQRVFVAAADLEFDWLDELDLDQALVAAFRADDGQPLWRHRIVGPNDLSTGISGLVATEEAVVATGQATLVPSCVGEEDCYPEDSDMLTVSLGSWNGVVRWRDRYDGLADATSRSRDAAAGLVIGDGTVYVTGQEEWDGSLITTTIAYSEAAGTISWVGRSAIPGPYRNAIAGLALAGEAAPRVIVAGTAGQPYVSDVGVAVAYDG